MSRIKKFFITFFSFLFLMTSVGGAILLANALAPTSQTGDDNLDENVYDDDTTSYVKVDEIWNEENEYFDATNLGTLLKYVTGDEDAGPNSDTLTAIENLGTQTSAQIRSKAVGGKTSSQDIIVRFGGLDWTVTYLSKDKDGNSILTLWLSSSKQDAFSGRSSTEGAYYGYLNGSLYSDWSADWYDSTYTLGAYPENMYGTSYIRAITLNNGGRYATSDSNLPTNEHAQNSNSAFAIFTMENVAGSVTDYIVKPNKVAWQETESIVEQFGSSWSGGYILPNESYGTPSSGSWYNNYSNKTNYTEWANDYIWLPSMTETGYSSSYIGIWDTSTEQRRNISLSTSNITPGVGSNNSSYGTYVRNHSWLRSGISSSASNAYYVNPSGASRSNGAVYASYAVRPALHLNLNKAVESLPTVSVGEIWNEDSEQFDRTNLGTLLKYVTGDENASANSDTLTAIENLGTQTSAQIRSKAVSEKTSTQDVVVRFGGLDWTVTYLSKDKDGNSILTLWLSSSKQDAFSGRSSTEGAYYGYLNGSLYSDWSADWYDSTYTLGAYPENMYGTSYIRAITLNNGGRYATSDSTLPTTEHAQNSNSAFAIFTMENVAGSVTDYIVKPNNVAWQETESAVTQGIDPTNIYPNEAYGTPSSGSWYPGYDYSNKTNYTEWANDYIWLPSMTETGYDSSHIGIWDTSTEQRRNISSSTSQITPGVGSNNSMNGTYVYNHSWLRSGYFYVPYSAHSFYLLPSGVSKSSNYVNVSYAVRPALHLNLTEAIKSTFPYVDIDEIWDGGIEKFNKENLAELLKYVTGNEDAYVDFETLEVINNMAEVGTTSADIRDNVVSGKTSTQDVVVRFGGLDWTVTYLSKDKDGNSILTLWLSSSKQDAFSGRSSTEGEYYGYLNGSLYSDWSADWRSGTVGSYPSNMYGTSYIRAITLNNGGRYATSDSNLPTTEHAQNSNSAFAIFTMENVAGSVTDYIVKPNKVAWQETESIVEQLGFAYIYPNEAYGTPSSGSWDNDYSNKTNYTEWANDYIWLPSLTETGYSSSGVGIWDTSTEQRGNISSSTSQITPGVGSDNSIAYVLNYSWLRSGSNILASTAYYLNPSGASYSNNYVNYSSAVRPALHLNLNEVLKSAGITISVTFDFEDESPDKTIYEIYGQGFYESKDGVNAVTSISYPTKHGYTFEGFFTERNGEGTQVVDGSGKIIVPNTFFTVNSTVYAYWKPNVPAYWDSEGGYWYIEYGKMPQSKVTDPEILNALNNNIGVSVSENGYYFAGQMYLAKVYNGEEYVKFRNSWYKVEPIRWRLDTTLSSSASGYQTTDTIAVMENVVYVGEYSQTSLLIGDGYLSANEEFSSTKYFYNNFSLREQDYLLNFSAETEKYTSSGIAIENSSSKIFLSSEEEILGVFENAETTFSNLVRDYLNSPYGDGEYYFTRDLGTNLNSIKTFTESGGVLNKKPTNILGMRFTIKVTEFVCL